MANQWFKFYGNDYLSDLKMKSLSALKRSCWITLLCYGAQSNGVINYLCEEQLKIDAGIAVGSEEFENTKNVLENFEKLHMITLDNGIITINNWSKRQESPLSAYERVKKYRQKKKSDNEVITHDNENDNDRIRLRIEKIKNRKEKKEEKLPDWLDKKVWNDWIEYRNQKRKKLTPQSIILQLKELEKNISKHKEIIEQSIRNGWIGLFPFREEIKVEKSSPRVTHKF